VLRWLPLCRRHASAAAAILTPSAITDGMSSLAFAKAPTLFQDSDNDKPTDGDDLSEEQIEEIKKAEAYADSMMSLSSQADTVNETGTAVDTTSSSSDHKPPSFNMTAFPGVQWADDWKCGFGSVRTICVSAWIIFLLMPTLFFTLTMPALQAGLPFDLTTFGLVLFALTAFCFFLTGCVNPGVPPLPKPIADDGDGGERKAGAWQTVPSLPHPGEAFSLSRDSNRYVRGFDHFCEFVGNDIGKGNLSCFVTFLVLLSLLSTYVVVLSGWLTGRLFFPPEPPWHFLFSIWRIVLASILVATLGYALYKCGTSELCSGVLPLIMMMPGATAGAVLIVFVIGATVLLPLTTDMLTQVSPQHNPVGFFLILPCLCFAVLFWGMSAHWVHLLCDGLTQKMWLRAKGYKRPRKPAEPDYAALV